MVLNKYFIIGFLVFNYLSATSQINSICVSVGFASPLELPELLNSSKIYNYNEGVLLKSSLNKSIFRNTSIVFSIAYFNSKIKNQTGITFDGGLSRFMSAAMLEFEIVEFKSAGLRFSLGPGYEIEKQSQILVMDSRVNPSYEIEIEAKQQGYFFGKSDLMYFYTIQEKTNLIIAAGYSYHHHFGRRRSLLFHLTTGISYTFL